jgi:hypothetical protein
LRSDSQVSVSQVWVVSVMVCLPVTAV